MVGIPGIGISGIFYLVAALLLPVLSFARQRKRRDVKWQNVQLVFALSLGILVLVWLTGWLLSLVLDLPPGWVHRIASSIAPEYYQNIIQLKGCLSSSTVLVLVLLAVQVSRLCLLRRQAGKR